jgi:glutathione synthase/RimK-type ligase-like ATP-grasp enzyme
MTEETGSGFASERAEEIWVRLAEKYGLDTAGMDLSALRAAVVREVLGGLPARRSGEAHGS